jgi:thymidylate synthase (FAD)
VKAEYITHMGDDQQVVNAARVSFNKHKDVFDDADRRLLQYLAKHGHWTPFAHPQITLRETVPIFVARQRFKHVVGFAYNEVSRRYVDDDPEFYRPGTWRKRPEGSVKQGSGDALDDALQALADSHWHRIIEQAMQSYKTLLFSGVAPELARMLLPQCMMTSYYVTGSLAAWARAYSLRIDQHAQREIQQLAEQWGEIIAPLFPCSWEALCSRPE